MICPFLSARWNDVTLAAVHSYQFFHAETAAVITAVPIHPTSNLPYCSFKDDNVTVFYPHHCYIELAQKTSRQNENRSAVDTDRLITKFKAELQSKSQSLANVNSLLHFINERIASLQTRLHCYSADIVNLNSNAILFIVVNVIKKIKEDYPLRHTGYLHDKSLFTRNQIKWLINDWPFAKSIYLFYRFYHEFQSIWHDAMPYSY